MSEKGWNLYAPPSGFIQPIWRPLLSYPGNAKSEQASGAGMYSSTSSSNSIAGAIASISFFISSLTGFAGLITSSTTTASSSISGSSVSFLPLVLIFFQRLVQLPPVIKQFYLCVSCPLVHQRHANQ